jgi:hypothetical protein
MDTKTEMRAVADQGGHGHATPETQAQVEACYRQQASLRRLRVRLAAPAGSGPGPRAHGVDVARRLRCQRKPALARAAVSASCWACSMEPRMPPSPPPRHLTPHSPQVHPSQGAAAAPVIVACAADLKGEHAAWHAPGELPAHHRDAAAGFAGPAGDPARS